MTIISIIVGLFLALAIFQMVRSFRRARTAPYFLLRRAAAVRGWRWFFLSMGSGIALIVISVTQPTLRFSSFPLFSPADSTSIPPPTLTLVAPPTLTPVPPTVSSTQTLSAATPIPLTPGGQTLVPTRTLGAVFATRESEVTPSRSASISITTVTNGIDDKFLPVNPGTALPAGLTRFYVFFDFEGMTDGVSWSGVVLNNGTIVEDAGFNQIWELGNEGVGWWRFFDRPSGWSAGSYNIQFYIGDKLADSMTFQIIADPSGSSSPTPSATP